MLGKPAKSLSIVDVGCSFPVFLEQAKAAGYNRVLGVDYSSEAVAYGAERGIDVITPEAFADLPDNSFDVLRYSHALEHMIDPREVLDAQIRKLRPGGLLYITQPNFPVFKAGAGGDIKDSVWPTHLHYFNPISLRTIVENAGAKEIRFYTVEAAEDAAKLYDAFIDLDYAKRHTADLAKIGEPARGEMSNFPYFAGENSAMFALKSR